jgi:hypothetical protein
MTDSTLRTLVRELLDEHNSPAPDYLYRKTLREQLRDELDRPTCSVTAHARCDAHLPSHGYTCLIPAEHSPPHYDPAGGYWTPEQGQVTWTAPEQLAAMLRTRFATPAPHDFARGWLAAADILTVTYPGE